MQYIIPHYYKKFVCIGGDCPDTCCAGWQIMIDPASLKKYRQIKGRLGSRLHNEIDWEEGAFRQYEKRCAFLNEENLCDLYIEGNGSGMFCKTCRLYPRHVEEFEGLREISLSLSCPEAANLILGCEEPVRFLEAENPDREETYEDFDFFLFTKLEDARTLIFQILQNREYPIRLRMAIVLALAHDLQERIDKNALFEIDGLLKRYEKERVWTWFQEKLDNLDIGKNAAGGLRQSVRDPESSGSAQRRLEGICQRSKKYVVGIRAVSRAKKRVRIRVYGEDHGTADGLFCIYLLLRGSLR